MSWLSSLIDYGIIGLLGILSAIAVAVAIERVFAYRRVKFDEYESVKELELALSDKLSIVASIASNAPYLGLLGAVCGIMLTFYEMGQNSSIDTGRIMIGLALALKATAIGLLVALIAVTIYNFLQRKCRVLTLRFEIENERGNGRQTV
ncbi:MAG: TonB-system energizer ExbB [Helicobacteraceae bacterium]|jgi:biopolymer transport protein ExbB|nr:TonB-system energizer ExbB [Helicobacteraceae bacterium]